MVLGAPIAGSGGVRRCGGPGIEAARCCAGPADQDFNLALAAAAQLLLQHATPDIGRDEHHPSLAELTHHFRRGHPRVEPRPPVDRDHAAWPAPVQVLCQFVEYLTGRCIITLTAVAEPPGDRAEEHEETQG